MSRGALRTGLAALALLAPAGPAAAHGTLEGVGAFYAGLLHPLLVPAHLLLLLGLGLRVAQRGRAAAPAALAGWLFGLGLGLGIVLAGAGPSEAPLPALALAAALGLLLAAAAPLPVAAGAALAALAGLALGLDSDPGAAADPGGRPLQLAGTAVGASTLVLLVGGALVERRPAWLALGLRVAGSWIAAAALMVLALGLRP